MKTITNAAKLNTSAVPQHRSFRSLVKQWFASFIRHQHCNCLDEFQKVMEKLQEIEDLIDMIAREMARQSKQGK